MTLSPRRKSLLMNRSLLTAFFFSFPLPLLGCCRCPQSRNKEGKKARQWPRLRFGNDKQLAHLGPHLLNVLQYHVAMPVERLYLPQQLPLVAAVDEHLMHHSVQRPKIATWKRQSPLLPVCSRASFAKAPKVAPTGIPRCPLSADEMENAMIFKEHVIFPSGSDLPVRPPPPFRSSLWDLGKKERADYQAPPLALERGGSFE